MITQCEQNIIAGAITAPRSASLTARQFRNSLSLMVSISISIFCKRTGGAADLEPLTLNLYGEIENWPEHFFGDEMADVTARTLAAMRRKISERRVSPT